MPKREVISYSELDTFRQCPLKHYLAYVARWKKESESPALSRGTAWHAVLEAAYGVKLAFQGELGDGPRPLSLAEQKALALKMDRAAQLAIRDSGVDDETKDLLLWMWQGYVQNYGVDPDWWIIAIEYKEPVILPNPDGKFSRFELKTRIDLVIRDVSLPGYPYKIVDHKTCSNLPTDKELDLDDQFGLYELAIRVAGTWPITGTIYSATRTKQNLGDKPGADTKKNKPQTMDQRFLRYRMTRNWPELQEIGRDAYYAALASRSMLNRKHPYASPNPDQCKWKCDFSDAHIAARKIGCTTEDVLAKGGYVQDYTRH